MQEINSALVLMGILAIVAIAIGIIVLRPSKEELSKKKSNPPKAKKSIKLFTQEGLLLYEYNDIFITHWDANIYLLSRTNNGKTFLRMDKGAGMLLVVESYEE